MSNPYKTITLRLNVEEYNHLKELANTSGLKMEPLLRKLIMGTTIHARPPDIYPMLLRELSAIGNNVNQIAHIANGKKDVAAAEANEAARLIGQVWRLVKDAF